jgi:septum site-determining protein MinC
VPQTFDIKSAQLPLVALTLKSPQLDEVMQELLAQFGPAGESSDFFDNDALVLDLAALSDKCSESSLKQLIKALQRCRLKPIAFRNANEDLAALARRCDLIEAPAQLPAAKSSATKTPPPVVKEVVREVVKEVVKEVVREVPASKTLVIDKPLRSGQKVYARGADLIVLSMVNPGAEVAADGNIHVYAPLRGKAMAGASGDTSARIFALALAPELISIAGVYRTSENALPANVQGKPAQVRLSADGQDKLIFEAMLA